MALGVEEGLYSNIDERRHFEQAPRVDRPPSSLSYATPGSLPATQGQRSKDQISQIAHLGLK